MANILTVISVHSPMGGTITKVRALMMQSQHKHVIYHAEFTSNKDGVLHEMEWYKQANIPAYYGLYNRNIFRNAQAVTQIIRKHDIDIIHFYFNHEQSFAGLVKLLNPKVKMVRSIVGYDKKLSFFRNLAVKMVLPYISNYIYISQYIKNIYEFEYPCLKRKKTHIIYNSAVNVTKEEQSIENRKDIVTVSGLCKRKNINVLIEAFNLIVNEYHRDNIRLYILGDGEERNMCENLIQKYQLTKNVILVGYTNKVPMYLNNCAVYVHPAITEGFGIAVTEAMEMHCPCIVSNKGALPELIIDSESGYVIEAFDPKQWAEKIIYLHDNVSERKRMGENAYNRAKLKFSLKAFVKNHDDFYDSLMAER